MLDNQIDFLNCPDRPFIWTAQQVAWAFQIHLKSVNVLVSQRFIAPLGNPSQNSHKLFYKYDIEAIAEDRKLLSKAVACIQEYWRQKNRRKKKNKAKKLAAAVLISSPSKALSHYPSTPPPRPPSATL